MARPPIPVPGNGNKLASVHSCLRPSCPANSPEAEPWTPRAGGASLLIPVPAPYGGAVVVGESSVAYVNGGFEGFEV